ncbi:hypothetical protein BB560_001244 [Smittium megazygosporum]|uniref:Translation machinery-associated protein 20 n=1 Tax=Smittium megazygosporum TaxID=133381 RepID=A0A2T9ZI61_9FUNG|nr:hypothetical protein BB560_001244 [Smittium megazygosporum]
MFKKGFSTKDINGRTMMKSSAIKSMKAKLIKQFPLIEPVIDEIFPKKVSVTLVKTKERITLYIVDNKIYFFQHFDDPLVPSLQLIHMYPDILEKAQVDRGAIKYVLSGANIMCPGLTSAGAHLPDHNIERGTMVSVMAEGKEHAMAVGITKMSTDEIKSVNKGIGIDLLLYLGDPVWKVVVD